MSLRDSILFIFALMVVLLPLTPVLPYWGAWWFLLLVWLFLLLTFRTLARRYSARFIATLLLVSLCLQAQIGIAQFFIQHDLNLYLLGESRLAWDLDGVAKFRVADVKLIRSYGFFEHANAYAGSLLLGLVLLPFVFADLRSRASYRAVLFVLLLGLVLAFSRSAYLGLGLLVTLLFWRRPLDARAFLSFMLLVSLFLIPFIVARTTDADDAAYDDRMLGLHAARALVSSDIMWRGFGSSYLLALERYYADSSIDAAPWHIDYPHSVFVLLPLYWGIVPALLFGSLLFLFTLYRYRHAVLWLTPLLPLISLDHYFVTHSSVLFYGLCFYFLLPRLLGR